LERKESILISTVKKDSILCWKVIVASLINQVERVDELALSAASALGVVVDVSAGLAPEHLLPPYLVLVALAAFQRY
jgi:hypothetical protein